MATTPAQLRDRISFKANQPVEVTLDSEGQQQESRNGETEYRYFLTGHQIMWVPEEAHAQIERILGGPGHFHPITVRITRKTGRWTVEHLDSTTSATSYGYGQPSPPTPPKQQREAAPDTAGSTTYYTCLCAALRAAQAAEQFAAQIQRPFSLDSSDIRAIATTLYIQMIGGRA